ncbi:hypothetical protein CL673_00695 [Candidatus Bathyarchaeota archaeon]|nr:hypothetical protein [Candidatus Bathyarchaeota archaeon]
MIKMHVIATEVNPINTKQGVEIRTLLKHENSQSGVLSVSHITLQPGSEIVFNDPMTEYMHYVIQGCIGFGGLSGDLLPSNTAIFIPCTKTGTEPYIAKHTIAQTGEAETRLLTVACKVSKPAFSWSRRLDRNLYHIPQYHSGKQITGQTKVLNEQELIGLGASRIHCVKVQSQATGTEIPPYCGPERIMYQLSSTGELDSDGDKVRTRPGSFIYTPEGEMHSVNNTHEKFPMQYVLVEFVDHEQVRRGE